MISAVALFATLALAQVAPPSDVTIDSISYGGSGCPQGTVAALFASDYTSVTLIFDQYIAQVGPGISPTQAVKDCQIALNIIVPSGYSYSIDDIDYHGYISLPPGGFAQQAAIYYFTDETEQSRGESTFTGSMAQDYTSSDSEHITKEIWSTCRAFTPLNIKTHVAISVPFGQSGQITTDSIDSKVTQIYGLNWNLC